MAEEIQTHLNNSIKTSVSLNSSNSKPDVEIRREKKKKLAAFKTFLDNKIEPTPLQELPKRKMSEEDASQTKYESVQNCKICSESLAQARLCEFCKEKVCASHLRKRRRYAETNKWTRICEFCEDKYLMEKHYQNEMKTEESLMTQEIIVQKKHSELQEILSSKKIKLQMLKNKKEQLEATSKKEAARLASQENDLEKKFKKLDLGLRENSNMELSIMSLEKNMPESLQNIYEFLQEENKRMTKDLVKYEKMCNDVVKARSQREKEMYREYYAWEEQKIEEIEETEKSKEECCIY